MISYRQLVSDHSSRKEQLLMKQKSEKNELIQRQSRELEQLKLKHKIENDILKDELNLERQKWSGSKLKKQKSQISLTTPKEIDAFLDINNSDSPDIISLHDELIENKTKREPLKNLNLENKSNNIVSNAPSKKINLEKIIARIDDNTFDSKPVYQNASTVIKRKLIDIGFVSDDEFQSVTKPLDSIKVQDFIQKKPKLSLDEDENRLRSPSSRKNNLKQDQIDKISALFMANYNAITETAEFFCPDNKTVDQGHVDVDCVLDKSSGFDQENLDATSALAALCETPNEQDFCGDL